MSETKGDRDREMETRKEAEDNASLEYNKKKNTCNDYWFFHNFRFNLVRIIDRSYQ